MLPSWWWLFTASTEDLPVSVQCTYRFVYHTKLWNKLRLLQYQCWCGMVKWQRIGLNQRTCATLGLVTTWQLAWLGLRWVAFTCVGWQITLWSLWQLTSRSSEVGSHEELYAPFPLCTLCSEKKHPLAFSFISLWVMCRFKQKLHLIYLRNNRFWPCRN